MISELATSCEWRGILLAGQAGVGKTRLAREAVAVAVDAGWTVRRIAATASSRCIHLGAFAQWIEDAEGPPLAMAHRVITALTAGADGRRLLVSIDDAHQLDELSALVVHQLVLQRSAVVIVTVRSGAPAPESVTALWKEGLLRRIELQPLSRSESAALLAAGLGLPPDQDCMDRMWRLSAGNALFLRQLVDQEQQAGRLVAHRGRCRWVGSAEVTPSLVELVERQIGAVSDPVRAVVDLVAVAEPLDYACLAGLAEQSAIEEADQRGLIRASGDVVLVGHPIYAEIRMKQCGPLKLRRLRGLVAGALTGESDPATKLRRGLLWMESDLRPDRQVLTSAAAAASMLLDFELAARLSSAAEDARVHRAYNLVLSQQGDVAAQVINTIASEDAPQSDFINDVVLRAANLLWNARSPQESWDVIEEGLACATGPRRGQLLAFRANQLMLAVRPADVVAMMTTADYGALDEYGQAVRLCCETSALAEVGRTADAITTSTACNTVLSSMQQGSFLGEARVEFHSFALAIAGHVRESRLVADDHLIACAAGPSSARALAAAVAGSAALAAGDLPRALELLPSESAADDPDNVLANSFFRFHLLRTQVLARLGDVAAAERAWQEAQADRHPAYVLVELNALLASAWLSAGRQQLAEARRLARRAVEFTCAHGQLAREVLCLQTLVQFDDSTVAERLAELATVVDGPRAPLTARYARALGDDDAVQLETVSTEFEEIGDLLTAADVAAQAASAHRRAGRVGSALTAAGRAATLATRCGNAISPALRAATITLPFTRREHEVAILVAQGMSNREIAEAVSLSVRTVEGHIYRASCKAGVVTRAELASVINRSVCAPVSAI